MKQTALTTQEFVICLLAIIGLLYLVVQLIKSLIPQPAPIFYVTVNMPETKQKELTAGDHAKGLFRIGYDKVIEKVIFLPLSLIWR
jgi:hypothetical protein